MNKENTVTEVLEEDKAPMTVLPVWKNGKIVGMYEVRKPLSPQTKAPFAIV